MWYPSVSAICFFMSLLHFYRNALGLSTVEDFITRGFRKAP
ncbi:hypothetical protein M758_7G095300 [Ceratodon purpureus]|nr:hypothetical protein M758_7G095300 [Ceratodon purpureus]